MTVEVSVSNASAKPAEKFRIGLALSGGGFRASIFHLGVIRRLEELGIMKDVDVISAVSGGSIIAAYYVCEMERRLREAKPEGWRDTKVRLEIFDAIAHDFLEAVDHNLRTRALVFTPFFHPILFIKTLVLKAVRAGARSELIQREYDRWFYDRDTLDQLPSVTPQRSRKPGEVRYGPQVIFNTTSLLTGKRVAFSREPNSAMMELKQSNNNNLLLSRVVGASSGVPVLFPPTHIFGDTLVDGGVADNQGIEALINEPPDGDSDVTGQILLVSDAAGQMDAIHTIGSGETAVFGRVTDILQFQVRSKLIDRLVQWKTEGTAAGRRSFAFVHLFLNLKDRGVKDRLPSELIPAVARIRTDLDQFSLVEREALMYHGYTLIDAQIAEYCEPLAKAYPKDTAPPLTAYPLFSATALDTTDKRDRVRKELETGAQPVFLIRSAKKYPARVAPVFGCWGLGVIAAVYVLFTRFPQPVALTQKSITSVLKGLTSGWVGTVIDWILTRGAGLPTHDAWLPGIGQLLGSAAVVAVSGYVLAFPTYCVVRRLAMAADRERYRDLTASEPGER